MSSFVSQIPHALFHNGAQAFRGLVRTPPVQWMINTPSKASIDVGGHLMRGVYPLASVLDKHLNTLDKHLNKLELDKHLNTLDTHLNTLDKHLQHLDEWDKKLVKVALIVAVPVAVLVAAVMTYSDHLQRRRQA